MSDVISATSSISQNLIRHVHFCLDSSLEVSLNGGVARQGDNSYCQHAFPAYFSAVAAVEAFVNESLLGQFAKIQRKESGLWNISDDSIDRFDIRTKLIIVPMLLFGNTFSRDAQPFQDFATLVRIRNDGIHFKMQQHAPKYVRDLSQRDIAITYDGIKENVADYDWPSKLSTTSGILWAHNTSCRVVQELVGFMSEDERKLMSWTVDSFQPLPDNYIKKWYSARLPDSHVDQK